MSISIKPILDSDDNLKKPKNIPLKKIPIENLSNTPQSQLLTKTVQHFKVTNVTIFLLSKFETCALDRGSNKTGCLNSVNLNKSFVRPVLSFGVHGERARRIHWYALWHCSSRLFSDSLNDRRDLYGMIYRSLQYRELCPIH